MKYNMLKFFVLLFLTQVQAETQISDAKRYFNLRGMPKLVEETECRIKKGIIPDAQDIIEDFCDTMTEQIFNNSGKEIQIKVTANYQNSTAIVDKTVAAYEGEKLISYKHYDKSETLTKVGIFSYPNKMTKEIINRNKDGEFVGKDILTYDNHGNWISYTAYGANDKTLYKAIIDYNEKHQQIAIKKYKGVSEKPFEEKHYVYNDKGFVSQEIEKMPKQITRIFRYITYDNRGNWLKKIAYENSNAKKIWYRSISYYK